MSTPRDIRRLAFQVLYQLDARGDSDAQDIFRGLNAAEEYDDDDRRAAFDLAVAAYADRAKADEIMTTLAPTWPVHRQAPVDRAILRLAHYEMTVGGTNPKIAINEAVELAKAFSTEKSPGFVNALLDRVFKGATAADGAEAGTEALPADPAEAPPDPADIPADPAPRAPTEP